jgi:hypothetical protein
VKTLFALSSQTMGGFSSMQELALKQLIDISENKEEE